MCMVCVCVCYCGDGADHHQYTCPIVINLKNRLENTMHLRIFAACVRDANIQRNFIERRVP